MTKRWIALRIAGCLATLSLLAFGSAGCSNQSDPDGQSTQQAKYARFVTIPEIFGDLERPPVIFDHDKHTAELEAEGCTACHGEGDNDDILFAYPEGREKVETSRNGLMNLFHDTCIECHTSRTKEGKKAGPVTCGECHSIPREHPQKEYVPVLPDYYTGLEDAYHKDCTACHSETAKETEEAGPLDWKKFYVAQTEQAEQQWPKVAFDYHVHDAHDKALEGDCQLCHYISPQREKEFKAAGKEPEGQDWVLDIDEKNSLSEREAAHTRCINCHLERQAAEKDAGPVSCSECHSGKERTLEELAEVARPECEMDERILIQLEEGARSKAVAFDHASHVANSRSCQECHHYTLQPCQDCHGIEGSEAGGFVTLAEAHHDVSSSFSCVGCHEKEKQTADCAGCHDSRPKGLIDSACSGCHTGSLETLGATAKLPAPKDLLPDETEDEFEICPLADEYKPSKMPHTAIIKRLTQISNDNSLAAHFHTKPTTMCMGCHHLGPMEEKTEPAPCNTCHTVRDVHDGRTPSLLGAYHQQCLACHKQMGAPEEEMPQSCTGCHEEEPPSKKK